jgi:hypothetical protein
MTCTSYWGDETKEDTLGTCDMQGREMSAGFSGKHGGKRMIGSPASKRREKFNLCYAM